MPGGTNEVIGNDRGDGTRQRHGQEIVTLAEAEHDAEEIGRQQDVEADGLRIPNEGPEHAADQADDDPGNIDDDAEAEIPDEGDGLTCLTASDGFGKLR